MSLIPDLSKSLAKMIVLIKPVTDSSAGAAPSVSSVDFLDAGVKSIVSMLNKLGKPIPFPAMYNPASFNITHAVDYCAAATAGEGQVTQQFKRAKSKDFKVDLLFDATGASVSPDIVGKLYGAILKGTHGIDILVNTFVQFAMSMNTKTHEMNRVTIYYGTFVFDGFMKSADIQYMMFDRLGRPIRAKVSCSFVSHIDDDKKESKKDKASPDLTKTLIVKAGDTLPLIALREYENESYYMELARVNNLRNYRSLKPGQLLVLPPLKKLEV